jgi:hypothetical protein
MNNERMGENMEESGYERTVGFRAWIRIWDLPNNDVRVFKHWVGTFGEAVNDQWTSNELDILGCVKVSWTQREKAKQHTQRSIWKQTLADSGEQTLGELPASVMCVHTSYLQLYRCGKLFMFCASTQLVNWATYRHQLRTEQLQMEAEPDILAIIRITMEVSVYIVIILLRALCDN